ncbi:transposase family protein [Streptomyces sp. NBC_01565]|nr:transposase family protein [Streptomyces sp. NBC_01565]
MRQPAPLFGIARATVCRVINRLGPLLALEASSRSVADADRLWIVDDTLVRSVTAPRVPRPGATGSRRTCRSSSTPTPAWSSRAPARHRVFSTASMTATPCDFAAAAPWRLRSGPHTACAVSASWAASAP